MPCDHAANLTGKYCFITSETHYRKGLVVGLISLEYYLVKIWPGCDGIEPWEEVISLDEMSECLDDGVRCWCFYTTEAAVDAYMAWLEKPAETKGPKLVNLKAREIN
jgi:hypothetical protein